MWIREGKEEKGKERDGELRWRRKRTRRWLVRERKEEREGVELIR